MSETVIRSRIDSEVKQEAQALLSRFGLTMSEAIRLFLHQVIIEKGLPFQVKLPDAQAIEHDRWFREQIKTALAEADDHKTVFVSHEKVLSQWKAKRQVLLKQSENKH